MSDNNKVTVGRDGTVTVTRTVTVARQQKETVGKVFPVEENGLIRYFHDGAPQNQQGGQIIHGFKTARDAGQALADSIARHPAGSGELDSRLEVDDEIGYQGER